MSDDFTILAADDQVVYNSNHLFWMDFWLSESELSLEELLGVGLKLNEEEEESLYVKKVIITAIFIVKKIAIGSNDIIRVKPALPFLLYAKQFVSGILFTFISQIQFRYGLIEPKQAPKGWKCSLCLESKDSHFAKMTECGHYFHCKCLAHLTNPSCPLCRQIMNV